MAYTKHSCVKKKFNNLFYLFLFKLIVRGKSINAAAKKFGLYPSTLNKMIKFHNQQEYQGKGRKSKVFTEEEESFIVQRYLL